MTNAIVDTHRLAGKKWALVVAMGLLEVPSAFNIRITHVHRAVAILTFGVALAFP